MRTISEQELKAILDKHGKWLRSEADGERANLSFADLRSADLSSADLSSANLRSANLRSADLSSANLSFADLRSADLSFADLRSANLRFADLRSADLSSADLSFADLRSANLRFADLSFANLRSADLSFVDLVVFQFHRSWAYFTLDGTLRIGCMVMPITEWVIGYQEIGKKEGYSEVEILMYGNFIKSCMELFEKENPK